MEAKLGDKLRLYEYDGSEKEVIIVERIEDGELFYDTYDGDGYGDTYPRYKSIEELIELYRSVWYWVEIIDISNIRDNWSDLLSGETVWVTKCELDEILDNLKSLNINTLMIQSCQDKFVVKVDEQTVIKFKETHNED